VGVEPERENLHLVLELAQAPGEVIPLLAEGLGQRHHGLDEPALAFVLRRDVFQAAPPPRRSRDVEQFGCRARAAPSGAHLARDRFARVTP